MVLFVVVPTAPIPPVLCPHHYNVVALQRCDRDTKRTIRMVRFVPFFAALVTLVVTAGANVSASKGKSTFISIPQACSIVSCITDARISPQSIVKGIDNYQQRTPAGIGDIFFFLWRSIVVTAKVCIGELDAYKYNIIFGGYHVKSAYLPVA